MLINKNNISINFNSIPESDYWSQEDEKELKIHKIHSYPAKFPSFVIKKAISYAEERGINLNTIADIFCGCGTTALEAKRYGIDFWGCDINPVATLIARVKSSKYQDKKLVDYFNKITSGYSEKISIHLNKEITNNERLNYWFSKKQIKELYKLLTFIQSNVPKGIYRDFFLCSFSNILKGTSMWLTKSIKPQLDPIKEPIDVRTAFEKQFNLMLAATRENNYVSKKKNTSKIDCRNFLEYKFENPFVDMLITSPPYVTSYEYADLHQLSSIWLGYTDDYRKLRNGTIGSLYDNNISDEYIDSLNTLGKNIYRDITKVEKRKAKSIAKYFLDIRSSIQKSRTLIRPGGLSVFVIGNTKYKGVEVDNAKYLTYCLMENGFDNINVYKRKIGNKILTPYRDSKGKFSTDKRHRKVYNYEFIVISQNS